MENKKIIEKCINSIEVDETLKRSFCDINYTGQLISHSKNKRNRKNYHKRFVSIAITMIIIAIFSNTLTYALTDKNIIEYFFSSDSGYKEYDLLEKVGKKEKIGKYTIEFKEQLYDSKTGFGYLVFVTTKEDGIPEVPTNISTEAFGENLRFYFEMDKSFDIHHEIIDKKLYSYIEFNDLTHREKVNVNIRDTKTNKIYKFDVKSTAKNMCFKTPKGDTRIIISALGLLVESNKKIDNKKVEVTLKNKKKIEICNTFESEKIGGTREHYSEKKTESGKKVEYYWSIPFEDMMNIDEIKTLYFNDEKLIETND
ncbi:MAG: hypothetical protein ACLRZ9_00230 [Eubacterium sp.]